MKTLLAVSGAEKVSRMMNMNTLAITIVTGVLVAAAPFAAHAAKGDGRQGGNGQVHKVMEKRPVPVAGNNGNHIGWCWGLGNIGLSNGKGNGVQLVETADGQLINKHGIDVSDCRPKLR